MASTVITLLIVTSLTMWTLSTTTARSRGEGRRRGGRGGERPNIVFFLADDLGFNDIGYHNPAMKTPNLDRLAAKGIKLENYYVQPVCSPTRSQLISGRYQIHTGLQHSIIWVAQPSCHPVTDPTIAQKLAEAGYSTHAVGKWHLGFYRKACWPTRRGFDSFFGMLTGSANFYTHRHMGGQWNLPGSGNWSGYDLRDDLEQVGQDYQGVYSTHLFTQKSQAIIREHDQSKPLFLYHAFQTVHFPLQVPAHYYAEFGHIADEKRRVYAGMVKCMDEAVGNITATLKESGMWNNTLLIFSTDNGGNLKYGGNNWPLRGGKRSLWEGGIRAVGFVSSPLLPKSARGTVHKNLFHVTDWFPTLVKGVAKGSLRGTNVDGYDVWKLLKRSGRNTGSADWPRKEIVHNIDPYSALSSALPQRFFTTFPAAIRYDNWKLLTSQSENGSWVAPPESSEKTVHPRESPQKRVWLFNLADDPNEKHDLSLERWDVSTALLRRLGRYLRQSVPVYFPPPDRRANPTLHNDSWSDWVK
ncbi:arylsulfatase B-like [Diadema antillarum]|uniref:arylsulfatase B-like n=1 Tax=Diadema antillarum TaxID=105358 RepID=UPI003A8B0DD9